jgi:NAD-dependent SIR2 family protein deacetylase
MSIPAPSKPAQSSEKYLRYAPVRDVLFVMGAGSSHPDGVPLQHDILPMIISDQVKEISRSVIGRQVREFIFDNFSFDSAAGSFPKLEAVFGFLDYFIQQNESLSSKYTYEKIREIKENFIKIIHYIVNLRTDKRSKTYHLFWDAVAQYNRNISIITLNYDTLLEQAFDFLFQKQGYIDYSIHLMNYDKLSELKGFNFWVNPREPILIQPGEDPVPIKIIKLHGSLNWKYCNCCNHTLLTPWDRKIDMNRGKLIGHTFPDEKQYDYYCPIDRTEFQTLIMPPSYIKSLNNPVITQLFAEASREIRMSRKIVFIGYSLSDADVHIKALFRKHLNPDVELVVVNPKRSANFKHHYHALSVNATFVQRSFENLVKDDRSMRQLLSGK